MDALATFPIAPGSRFRHHAHDSVHVCMVLDGGFLERDGHDWRSVGPGWLRVSAAARHDIDFGPAGARCLLLETQRPAATDRVTRLPRPRFLQPDAWLARVARRIATVAEQTDPARDITLDGLAVELLAQIDRRLDGRRASPPPWLGRVRERIQDLRGVVTVSELAREAGVHRVHLARTFREHVGVAVTDYARRVRLEVAQRLLLSSPVPIAQVAAHAGFADQSHLTRVMRATLGITPAAARHTDVTSVQDAPPPRD